MKKEFLLLLLCAMTYSFVNAQIDDKTAAEEAVKTTVKAATVDSAKHWKFTGMVGLNASQTALFNWAAGGDNNITVRQPHALFQEEQMDVGHQS